MDEFRSAVCLEIRQILDSLIVLTLTVEPALVYMQYSLVRRAELERT
jgi:hypothetical protein